MRQSDEHPKAREDIPDTVSDIQVQPGDLALPEGIGFGENPSFDELAEAIEKVTLFARDMAAQHVLNDQLCSRTRPWGPSRRWRPTTTGTPSRGASATPGGCPASARRACPPRGPWPASSSSCSSRSCRRRDCAGGCTRAASTGTTRSRASSTRRGRPGATRGRATAPACARSPGGSATSSTGWATGCRPRHNSPGI